MPSLARLQKLKKINTIHSDNYSHANTTVSRDGFKLGPWSVVRSALEELKIMYFCFPMGAVPKPHQPEVMRPTSDHTKTGFNAATIMGILKHSLDSFNQASFMLQRLFYGYVSGPSSRPREAAKNKRRIGQAAR